MQDYLLKVGWIVVDRKESFEQISKEISYELNIENIIVDIETSKLISCDTYEKCDQIVISHLLTKLQNDSIL